VNTGGQRGGWGNSGKDWDIAGLVGFGGLGGTGAGKPSGGYFGCPSGRQPKQPREADGSTLVSFDFSKKSAKTGIHIC